MRSEALPEADSSASLAELLRSLVARDDLDSRLRDGQRVMELWARANGDLERRHTNRAWLRPSGHTGMAPILVVEVDSHAVITDLNAKRDLYLGRLAHYGQQVSRIEFRYAPRREGAPSRRDTATYRSEHELSDAQRRRVDELAAMVDGPLRDVVRSAVMASMRQ